MSAIIGVYLGNTGDPLISPLIELEEQIGTYVKGDYADCIGNIDVGGNLYRIHETLIISSPTINNADEYYQRLEPTNPIKAPIVFIKATSRLSPPIKIKILIDGEATDKVRYVSILPRSTKDYISFGEECYQVRDMTIAKEGIFVYMFNHVEKTQFIKNYIMHHNRYDNQI